MERHVARAAFNESLLAWEEKENSWQTLPKLPDISRRCHEKFIFLIFLT
jgi:hypothetical protein